MMINILFIFGQLLRNILERWWANRQNSFSTPPPLTYIDDTIWPETNNNWHEDPNVFVWHASPTNEWEAASLSPGWGDFTPYCSCSDTATTTTGRIPSNKETQTVVHLSYSFLNLLFVVF
jgi:hypothetical protein